MVLAELLSRQNLCNGNSCIILKCIWVSLIQYFSRQWLKLRQHWIQNKTKQFWSVGWTCCRVASSLFLLSRPSWPLSRLQLPSLLFSKLYFRISFLIETLIQLISRHWHFEFHGSHSLFRFRPRQSIKLSPVSSEYLVTAATGFWVTIFSYPFHDNVAIALPEPNDFLL